MQKLTEVSNELQLGVHLRDQMLRLGELGWLYLTLGQRLKAILNTSTSGTVELVSTVNVRHWKKSIIF